MLLTFAATTLGACSLIVDLSPLGSSADASPVDSTASDVTSEATADASDAGPNVNACGAVLSGAPVALADPGFEQGCGAWTAYQSTLTDDNGTPLAGKIACRVCATGGLVQIEQLVPNVTAQVGETYEFIACVRDAPDAASVGSVTAGVGVGATGLASSPVPLTSTYQPVRIRWTTTISGALGVSVQDPNFADAGCYLIDETSLWKLDGG